MPFIKTYAYLFAFFCFYSAQLFCSSCNCVENGPNEYLSLTDIIDKTFSDNLEIYNRYQEIENRMGLYKQEQGRFDTNLSARVSREYLRGPTFIQTQDPPLFYNDVKEKTATSELEIFLERRFRSGIFVRPSIFIQRIDDNLQVPKTQTLGQLKLTVEVPLMRNLGYEFIGAGEIAAGLIYQGTVYNFKHQTANIIATVAKAYWQYVYAKERLASFIKAFYQTQEFLEGLEKMIAAGEVAPTEIHQVITDLETRRSNINQGEQDLFRAKQTLMLLMNVDPEEYNCYGIIQKPFPYATEKELRDITCEIVDFWINYAKTQRADYLALHLFQEAATFLVNQAENNLEPELNVTFDVSTRGLKDGKGFPPYPESLASHVRGANLKGTISLNTPLCQSFDRGVLQSRRSDLRKLQAQTSDLLNNIKSDILTRASGIQRFSAEIAALTIAVKEANQAVLDEIRKFQMGVSTVFDIIQLKDRALNSEILLIDAKFNYISTVIELRFFAGLIIPIDELTSHIDEDQIVAIPDVKICGNEPQHKFK